LNWLAGERCEDARDIGGRYEWCGVKFWGVYKYVGGWKGENEVALFEETD